MDGFDPGRLDTEARAIYERRLAAEGPAVAEAMRDAAGFMRTAVAGSRARGYSDDAIRVEVGGTAHDWAAEASLRGPDALGLSRDEFMALVGALAEWALAEPRPGQ